MDWVKDHIIETLVFAAMVLHTILKLGEWKRQRETPCIDEAHLLNAIQELREEMEGKYVHIDVHEVLHRSLDRRVSNLERGGRRDR